MRDLTLTALLVAALASPAAAEIVRWSDGENIALIDADALAFRWERLHNGPFVERDGLFYVGSTEWADATVNPINGQWEMAWNLGQITPDSIVSENDLEWIENNGEGVGMWSRVNWLDDGSIDVAGFRHWYTNQGSGWFARDDHRVFLQPVPEPSALGLLVIGAALTAAYASRRRPER